MRVNRTHQGRVYDEGLYDHVSLLSLPLSVESIVEESHLPPGSVVQASFYEAFWASQSLQAQRPHWRLPSPRLRHYRSSPRWEVSFRTAWMLTRRNWWDDVSLTESLRSSDILRIHFVVFIVPIRRTLLDIFRALLDIFRALLDIFLSLIHHVLLGILLVGDVFIDLFVATVIIVRLFP